MADGVDGVEAPARRGSHEAAADAHAAVMAGHGTTGVAPWSELMVTTVAGVLLRADYMC